MEFRDIIENINDQLEKLDEMKEDIKREMQKLTDFYDVETERHAKVMKFVSEFENQLKELED